MYIVSEMQYNCPKNHSSHQVMDEYWPQAAEVQTSKSFS